MLIDTIVTDNHSARSTILAIMSTFPSSPNRKCDDIAGVIVLTVALTAPVLAKRAHMTDNQCLFSPLAAFAHSSSLLIAFLPHLPSNGNKRAKQWRH